MLNEFKCSPFLPCMSLGPWAQRNKNDGLQAVAGHPFASRAVLSIQKKNLFVRLETLDSLPNHVQVSRSKKKSRKIFLRVLRLASARQRCICGFAYVSHAPVNCVVTASLTRNGWHTLPSTAGNGSSLDTGPLLCDKSFANASTPQMYIMYPSGWKIWKAEASQVRTKKQLYTVSPIG